MRYFTFIFTIIIIGTYLLQTFIPGITTLLLLTPQAFYQPWRFFTAIFLHGSGLHVLYNLFALLLFGFILEKLAGSRIFFMVFFVSGILANFLSVFFYPRALGASGAIFGIIGALTMIRPFMTVWAFSLPMPLFLASLLWAIGDFLGVLFPAGTANLAHISGLGIGFIMGIFLKEKRNPGLQPIEISEEYMRRWEDTYMK